MFKSVPTWSKGGKDKPMLYCKTCKVHLSGNYTRCPLCKGDLTGKSCDTENRFPPDVSLKEPNHVLIAWFALGSVIAMAVSIAINLILPSRGWWFMFVVCGVVSCWISFAFVLKKRTNIPKTVIWQVFILSILAYAWDRFTGFQGWSLNFVLPILCTGAMIAMSVIAKVKKLNIQDYIFYLIIDFVFGILSFTLLAVGRITIVIPSAICFASTLIFLAALLIFQGKALLAEIQRRFHL